MTKPYAEMSAPERWQWHAEVYAFRRVQLDVTSDVCVSPCDPDGLWYSEALVAEAVRRLRAKREGAAVRRRRFRDAEIIAGGRHIADDFARRRGFAAIDEYAMANEKRIGDAYGDVVRSILGEAPVMRRPNATAVVPPHLRGAAVLAAARRELGLPDAVAATETTETADGRWQSAVDLA